MVKLKDFFNKISNDNRIFTAEDIGEMSSDEFSQNEKSIDYQLNNLGVPRRNDLLDNSDVVYVHAYTRADGTHVKAHFRSKNGSSNFSNSIENVEQPTLQGGVTYNDYQIDKKAIIDEYFNNLKGNINTKLNEYVNNFNKNTRVILDEYFNRLNDRADASKIKSLLDALIYINKYIFKQKDARNLWEIASDSKNISDNDYVKENGTVYDDVNSLGHEFAQYKTKIKEKVHSQFGIEDTQGIVFHENSSVAKEIVKSPEIDEFIKNNYAKLKSGKEVSGSLRFNGFTNLHNAFGSVDILSAKLQGDYVNILILDTYDFNKNDKNYLVKMARKVQDAGKLNPYFTITKCKYKLN